MPLTNPNPNTDHDRLTFRLQGQCMPTAFWRFRPPDSLPGLCPWTLLDFSSLLLCPPNNPVRSTPLSFAQAERAHISDARDIHRRADNHEFAVEVSSASIRR